MMNFQKIMTIHIIDLPIKQTYHLMPFFMFFTNIIIASTTNSNLSNFCALKSDEFSKKNMTVHITDLPIKQTYHWMPFFMFSINIIIASTTNSYLSTF